VLPVGCVQQRGRPDAQNARFLEGYVLPRINGDFGQLYRYLSDPYPDGPTIICKKSRSALGIAATVWIKRGAREEVTVKKDQQVRPVHSHTPILTDSGEGGGSSAGRILMLARAVKRSGNNRQGRQQDKIVPGARNQNFFLRQVSLIRQRTVVFERARSAWPLDRRRRRAVSGLSRQPLLDFPRLAPNPSLHIAGGSNKVILQSHFGQATIAGTPQPMARTISLCVPSIPLRCFIRFLKASVFCSWRRVCKAL